MTTIAHQESREGLWPDEARGPRKRRRERGGPGGGSGVFGFRRFAGNGERGEQTMVGDAEFTSYYDRPIVKPAPWSHDIAEYLFVGGLAAGSSLLAAGADLTGLPGLRRQGRVTALVSIGAATYLLIHDLGRPERFLNMMRVVKLTSPMSVGSWILAGYGPCAGLAAAAELAEVLTPRAPEAIAPLGRLVTWLGRPAGLAAAFLSPPLAAYTAVLLGNTSTPGWHAAYKELPMVFAGSAGASAAGLAMIAAPHEQTWPARRLAVGGALWEIASARLMEHSMGLSAQTLHEGRPRWWYDASKALTLTGAALTVLGARRSKAVSVAAGLALAAGSVCTRFAVFEAGIASAKDPRYTVVPQRERLDRGLRTLG
ncbi:NrfD/PsrC family molybdoenzyme membrane anchor subunit [Arsenicicoccus dermatophilus]|uniref:NrfD/PsrC family molybdoenzyme membrane anchor subunit n=1 Tax=Arsenicicoccus dermatophilus TaxID=1076331 RepID=UPI0039172172